MKLTEVLVHMGFKQSHYDYSLFTKLVNGDTVMVLVYVDDLLVTGNNYKLLCDTRQEIQKKFKMKDLGELKFFLGIEFSRSVKGIVMPQRKYALELVAATGLGGAKPVGTPLEVNQKLTSVKYDEHINNASVERDNLLADPTTYQRLVGRLLYLTMTRPDLAFSIQVLSQFMLCPKQSHMEAALKVFRYIKEAPGMGLLMPAGETTQLTAYCDSNWGACLETRRSVIGYLVKFGGGLSQIWRRSHLMEVKETRDSVKEISRSRVQKHGYMCSRNNLADRSLQGTRCMCNYSSEHDM
ncbi:uncharacterized mitochondrial protein AtMg00810-like [Capsicum annuum]|uniref:uncharacterized mitochondrial protein AtMg00810-like n=1 Tax=Capsicum annuum TaxID=4072 RepID=UPI0007BFE20A|nr:uncharacterized mitochondrial protein AtMg00810-like [Capsicum annuum]